MDLKLCWELAGDLWMRLLICDHLLVLSELVVLRLHPHSQRHYRPVLVRAVLLVRCRTRSELQAGPNCSWPGTVEPVTHGVSQQAWRHIVLQNVDSESHKIDQHTSEAGTEATPANCAISASSCA